MDKQKTVLVASKFEHNLKVAKGKVQFSNNEDLHFEFGPDKEPVEMPEDIFKSYNESKKGRYCLVGEGQVITDDTGKDDEDPGLDDTGKDDDNKFDAIKYLEEQAKTEEGFTKEALELLEKPDLFELAKVVKVKNLKHNTGKPKLIGRLLGVLNPDEDPE